MIIVAGMQRYTALKNLFPDDYMVVCHLLEVDDKEAMVISTTENLARASMTVMDQARAFAKYFDVTPHGSSAVKISDKELQEYNGKVGFKYRSLRNRINLLRLPNNIQEELDHPIKDLNVRVEVAVVLHGLFKIKGGAAADVHRTNLILTLWKKYKSNGSRSLEDLRSEIAQKIFKVDFGQKF